MKIIRKNNFVLTIMLTFAILTTMTIMVQQKVFGTGIFGSADDGISMNNAKEKVNEAGKHVEKELQMLEMQ